MDDDRILTAEQRADLAAATGTPASSDDAELLTAFAEQIDMSGELAVDPEGVLELELDDVLVALQSVPDEDRDLADHPDMLHLAILLRPESDEERTRLEAAELLDPGEEQHGQDDEWVHAWWGSLCTQLHRDAPLSEQLRALNRAMTEAQVVLERGTVGDWFERIAWLRLDDEPDDDTDDTDDDDGN